MHPAAHQHARGDEQRDRRRGLEPGEEQRRGELAGDVACLAGLGGHPRQRADVYRRVRRLAVAEVDQDRGERQQHGHREQLAPEQDDRREQRRRLDRQQQQVLGRAGAVMRRPAIEHAVDQLEAVGHGKAAREKRRAGEREPDRAAVGGRLLHARRLHREA